jgi:hypothetical protein
MVESTLRGLGSKPIHYATMTVAHGTTVQGKIINGLVAGGTLGGWAGVKPLSSDHPLYSAALHPLSTDGRAVATATTLTITDTVHSHIPLVTAPGTPLWCINRFFHYIPSKVIF